MPRPASPLLSRDAIIETAIKVLDDKGENALTLRGVAKVLGVNPTSLYNHIDSLETLLDATVKRIVGDLKAVKPSRNWQNYLMKAAFEYRALLLKHPNAIMLIMSRRHQSYALPSWEQSINLLESIGFTLAEAQVFLEQFISLVIGSTLMECREDLRGPALLDDDYPATKTAMQKSEAWSPKRKLRFVITALLRGMESHLAERQRQPS